MKLGEMKSKMPCAAFGCHTPFQQATKLLHPGVQWQDLPPFPLAFPGLWAPAAGQLSGRASPALSRHAGGGWLHNSFPISCTLPALL